VAQFFAIPSTVRRSLGPTPLPKEYVNIFSTMQRENWGLSADAELNHHPSLKLKKLDSRTTLNTTWLRVERQMFIKWSENPDPNAISARNYGAILFCIRVKNFLLNDIVVEPGAAQRIAHVLQTMPEAVAVYKGIADARGPLIEQLRAIAQ